MSHFLVAYDIVQNKRRVQVAKLVYGYALGGQKSALELPVSLQEAREIARSIGEKIDTRTDRVNLIRVEEEAILLGCANQIKYDEGVIIL